MRERMMAGLLGLILVVGCSAPKVDERWTLQQTAKAGELEPWPFTVDEVTLECGGVDKAPLREGPALFSVVTAAGRTYVLNAGADAMAKTMGWFPKVETIWKLDPAVPGARVDILPAKLRALTPCEQAVHQLTGKRTEHGRAVGPRAD